MLVAAKVGQVATQCLAHLAELDASLVLEAEVEIILPEEMCLSEASWANIVADTKFLVAEVPNVEGDGVSTVICFHQASAESFSIAAASAKLISS